ncbi:MAG: TIGR01459 family HAD-type hydrolase [Alphaproteobacteria bacterium]
MLAANSNFPKRIRGLEELAPFYDGFILDLWGVVHDGVKPFEKTIETLQELKRAKRIVWLLSNAPRRARIVAEKLTEMGIAEDLYDGVLTSGEATWMALKEKYLEKWGRRCFHLGPREKDASLYEGLIIDIVETPGEADFVLNSGVYDFNDTADKYQPILQACMDRGLPMLCANPDRIVHVEDKLVLCPGTFADTYEQMGGIVTYFGKPHRAVYSLCLESMGVQKVLAVGDGMQTDIAGATGAGLDSVLVTSGIHRNEVADENRLQELLRRYPYRPAYLMYRFCW